MTMRRPTPAMIHQGVAPDTRFTSVVSHFSTEPDATAMTRAEWLADRGDPTPDALTEWHSSHFCPSPGSAPPSARVPPHPSPAPAGLIEGSDGASRYVDGDGEPAPGSASKAPRSVRPPRKAGIALATGAAECGRAR